MHPQPPPQSRPRRTVRKARRVNPDLKGLQEERELFNRLWLLKSKTKNTWDVDRVRDEIDRIFREDEDKTLAANNRHERLIVETWAQPFGTRPLLAEKNSANVHEVERIRDQVERYLWIIKNPGTVKWRMYVNAVPQHAADLALHIADLIRSSGLNAGVKMGSYPILSTGRDAIVCYLERDADLDAMKTELQAWLVKNDSFVSERCVRFSKRVDKGLSYTMDPPVGLPWVDLALEWEETDAGKKWREQNTDMRVNPDGAMFSFSQLIVEILFSCLLRATTLKELFDFATEEITVNAGLDESMGRLDLQAAIIGCLTPQLYIAK